MFIDPKDCLHYQVCKFADDAGCLDGCDFRIEKPTSHNSDYAAALYKLLDEMYYDGESTDRKIVAGVEAIQRLNASHFA